MTQVVGLGVDEQVAMEEVFGKIKAERQRQLGKLFDGEIPIDLFKSNVSLVDKLLHITEEAGEVAKGVRKLTQEDRIGDAGMLALEELETELVQLATHAVMFRASLI